MGASSAPAMVTASDVRVGVALADEVQEGVVGRLPGRLKLGGDLDLAAADGAMALPGRPATLTVFSLRITTALSCQLYRRTSVSFVQM